VTCDSYCLQVITFEQGIRFLADFIDGDTYYHTHPDRGGMHNLQRAQCQFAYLRSMEEHTDAMQRIVEEAMATEGKQQELSS
jgi:hypothetical protein